MAGKSCPQCGQLTFFETPTGRKCSKCGFSMKVPPNKGMGGPGKTCTNCGRMTVYNNKCTSCGATYKGDKK